jgi:diadenylate cyclase
MENFSLTALALPGQFRSILSTLEMLDILDIFLVAIILYKIYEMLEDTRAITLVKGVIFLLVLTLLSNWLNLHAIYWLLSKMLTLLFVALPIVFQPELRRALEHLGEGRFLAHSSFLNDEDAENVIQELDSALRELSAVKTGALIVIERNMGLNDICRTGVQIDGLVSKEFLRNIFFVNTPLHDGAAVIRGKRVIAAGCLLPLTENRTLSTELGTRHRAGIGLSEQCDALVLIVSEETGIISVAENGHIHRNIDSIQLKEYLRPIFAPEKMSLKEMVANWRNKKK